MTDEERNLITTFEARLRQLMFLHNEQKRKNEELLAELKEKEQAMQRLQEECRNLMTDYTNLKQARIISIRDEDVNDTKRRLSRLVREIDKCLALLNG